MKKQIGSLAAFVLSVGFLVFPVLSAHAATGTGSVNYLIVAGGGSGERTLSGGSGGGAGGLLAGSLNVTQQAYPIVVGNGGVDAGGLDSGQNGGDSTAFGLVAVGGGHGNNNDSHAASNGGSGGGGFASQAPGLGTSGQGNNGGSSYYNLSLLLFAQGGGGGAGSVGGDGSLSSGGNGGSGVSSSISGSLVCYAGGGGGSSGDRINVAGLATCGGGNGTVFNDGGDALASTGGGGGGSRGGMYNHGGSGGSGVVIISYPTGSLAAAGGTITTDGAGNTVHTFTSSGTFTVTSAVPVIHVTSVTLNESSRTLMVGGTDQLTASVVPAGATNQAVTFSSSAPSVASVSSTGLVTALAEGTATITVTTADGGFTATDVITVTKAPATANRLAKFMATSPSIFGDSLFADDGSDVTLTAGNLFMQIGSMIDSVTNGALSFGTKNATTLTFGRSGQNAIFNGNLGIGTSTPGSPFAIEGVANFSTGTTTFYGEGINLTSGCFAVNGVCIGGSAAKPTGVIDVSGGGTGSTTPLGGILVGNGLNFIKSLVIGKGLTFDGTTLSVTPDAVAAIENCASTASPAVCGAAQSGSVAIPSRGSTLVVNTTKVTANSQILITEDSSLGARLGITCNSSSEDGRNYRVVARTAGTSFTIKAGGDHTKNRTCLSFLIVN